ncbi:MAG TPA: dihydrofolate reductase family protein [Puia sp.]|nr:dihydrofolate reductase family protein [Puia sp.]
MGKIIALGHISLDGYMSDLEGKIDIIKMDEEVARYVAEFWKGAGGTIYGRKTYQLMDPFWPNVKKEPAKWPGWMVDYAEWVDEAVKVVVTRTLGSVSWQNTRLIRDRIPEEIGRIKAEVKGNLLLLASAQVLAQLLPARLVDEVVVTVWPVVLGAGNGIPYFKQLPGRVTLELQEERRFRNGAMGLRYGVVTK